MKSDRRICRPERRAIRPQHMASVPGRRQKSVETCRQSTGGLRIIRRDSDITARASEAKKVPKSAADCAFFGFFRLAIPKEEENIPDYGPVRAWVIERIEKETKATRKALFFIRRDLAMLACLCAAPERGSPRRWPKGALKVAPAQGGGLEVTLWDKPINNPGLTLALLYWHSWRARLDRPEQSRLHRKAWAYSDLLFPNSTGEVLGKQ